ncbi:MAG: TolC family protein [Saprospiraceae bacterium]
MIRITASLSAIIVLLILMMSPKVGMSQASLDTYIQNALERNANLQNYHIEGEISSLETQKLKTQYEKPQWALTGDYLLAPFFFNKGQVVAITANPATKAIGYDAGITNGGLYSAQINVNYPVFTQKLSRPLVKQQELVRENLSIQARQTEAGIRHQITTDYVNAFLLQQQMDFVGELKTSLQEQSSFVRKLADRGIMRITDLELLNLEIHNQDLQLQDLQGQFRQAMLTLRSDAGVMDTTLTRLPAVDLRLNNATDRSVFLESYRLDSLSADNDQAIFETRYTPQVNVFANGGINAVELNNIYRKVGISAGIHVSWLINDGGQRDINAQQNELRRLMAGNQATFSDLQIRNNRQNYQLLLEQNRRNVALFEEQLNGYEQLLTSYKQELALGQISVVDYLNVVRIYRGLQQQKIAMQTQLLLIINELNYWNN